MHYKHEEGNWLNGNRMPPVAKLDDQDKMIKNEKACSIEQDRQEKIAVLKTHRLQDYCEA